MGGIVKRRIEVGVDTCLLGFSGRSYIKSHAFDASTLSATGGVNEVQTVTVTGSPGGGTFTLKYRGQETGTINYNGAASAVQTALRALSNVGSSSVTVTGSNGGPYAVTFGGPLGNTDVFMLQLGTNAMTGGTTPSITVAQTTQGVNYDPRYQIGSPTKPGTIVTQVAGTPKLVKEYTAAGGVAEIQSVAVTGSPSGGTFRLNYRGDETNDIARNATAAAVQTALNALDTIAEDGGVVCAGGDLPTAVTVTFNNLGARPALTLSTNGLTGGTTPSVTVTESTAGVDAEAIFGVIDGQEEFMINSSAGNKDVAVYQTACVFDADKIKNYSTYAAPFAAWCASKFNLIENT